MVAEECIKSANVVKKGEEKLIERRHSMRLLDFRLRKGRAQTKELNMLEGIWSGKNVLF